jgi:segregation and condensation protein B
VTQDPVPSQETLAQQAASWVPPWQREKAPASSDDAAPTPSDQISDTTPDVGPDEGHEPDPALNPALTEAVSQDEPVADEPVADEPVAGQPVAEDADELVQGSESETVVPVPEPEPVEAAEAAEALVPDFEPFVAEAVLAGEATASETVEVDADAEAAAPEAEAVEAADADADAKAVAPEADAGAFTPDVAEAEDVESQTSESGAVQIGIAEAEDDDPAQLAAMDSGELAGALEAILMVVDEPVSEIMLAQVLEQPADVIAFALRDLARAYTQDGRGFELRQAAGGWRFYTREAYASYVERFVLDGQSVRLTQAALETLAVVAYKQPVTRSRISAIRGVNCDGVVRTLMSRGLIEECGAEPDSGAHLYRTTGLFLEKLGLGSVDELPALAPFLPDNIEEIIDADR